MTDEGGMEHGPGEIRNDKGARDDGYRCTHKYPALAALEGLQG